MKKVILSLFFVLSYSIIFAQSSDVDQKLYQGLIKDSLTGKLFRDGLIEVFNTDPKLSDFSGKINNETGEYSILMRSATKYLVRITSPYIHTKEFYFESARGIYEDIKMDILVDLIPVGKVLFEGNLFKPGTAEIIAANKLDNIIRYMDTSKAIVLGFGVWADAPAPQVVNTKVENKTAVQNTTTDATISNKPKSKSKKKNNKPAVQQEVLITTPAQQVVHDTTAALSEEQIKQLISDRCLSIREYFKARKISTTRIEFDKKGITTNGVNAKISIKMIRLEKDDD